MSLDQSLSISEIIIFALTITTGALGYIIREQREKIKMIQNQLSDKKYTVYHEIYAIFFDLFKQQKGLIKNEQVSDVATRMIDVKKDLFIYAPDNIVKKFLEWNNIVTNDATNKKHFKVYLELFILIRKDMGHKKTYLVGNDVLRSIMISDKDYKELIKMID